MPKNKVKKVNDDINNIYYHLRSEIYYGYSIPKRNTNYSIIIEWGGYETEPLKAKG